jgi:hypothetical protein
MTKHSKPVLLKFLPVILGFAVGLCGLNYFSVDRISDKDLEELALGKETSALFGRMGNTQVHCADFANASLCIDGYRRMSGDEVILWLGNSQLHSINQMKPGDETASVILNRRFKSDSKYYMTFSEPNANLQEHYVLFEYLVQQLPIKTLVLPVVMDSMRNTNVRSSMSGIFKQAEVVTQIKKSSIGRSLLLNQSAYEVGYEMASVGDEQEEQLERYLNAKLEAIWPVWGERGSLRGKVFLFLYQFRNWLLGINPTTTRKVIPGRYALNMQALEALLQSSSMHGVKVLLYIVPIRSDMKIPYDLAEYNAFKLEMRTVVKKFGARFVNLENLVPAKYWGTKNTTNLEDHQEIDFMHFQAGGHKLLANQVYQELKSLFAKEKP